MKKNSTDKEARSENIPDLRSAQPYRALEIDIEYYQRFLDMPELTETQKEEFIRALWGVICSFVDLGFQLNPVQKFSGEPAGANGLPHEDDADMVDLADTLNTTASPGARSIAARDERTPQ